MQCNLGDIVEVKREILRNNAKLVFEHLGIEPTERLIEGYINMHELGSSTFNPIIINEEEHSMTIELLTKEKISPRERKKQFREGLRKMINKGKKW
jgi:hypothetical protein